MKWLSSQGMSGCIFGVRNRLCLKKVSSSDRPHLLNGWSESLRGDGGEDVSWKL